MSTSASHTSTPARAHQGDVAAATAPGFDAGFLGVQAPLPAVGEREVVELAYTHFSVLLDTERALAACAAVNIDGGALVVLPRADHWRLDPRVGQDAQSEPGVYANAFVDRGHLVRPRDPCRGPRATAEAANADTFCYVNAAPQVAVFDQSKDLWLGLEDHLLRTAAAAGGRLSVLTGPVLAGDDPVYRGVAIARRFYKIAAWVDAASGALAATGYVLDQSALLARIGIAAPLSLRVEAGAVGLGAYRPGAHRLHRGHHRARLRPDHRRGPPGRSRRRPGGG